MTTETQTGNPVEQLQTALPASGLFKDKAWRITPEAFPLSPDTVAQLERLGPVLSRFQRTCNLIYRRSSRGSLPGWVANYLNQGKPQSLIDYGLASEEVDHVPAVIRPDVILTETGLSITELDTVPGGIGLTGWLNREYSRLGQKVIGGPEGMVKGFGSLFPEGADIVISEESADYRPEMEWLVQALGSEKEWGIHAAETYEAGEKAIYRFFELFDLKNVPFAQKAVSRKDPLHVTAPLKAFLEEKMWLALFWMYPLREVWMRELRSSNFAWLQELIPYGWIVDPTPLPHHAVLPRLDAQSFQDLATFSQKERNLVLKVSGFSEKAWGSRGVEMAMDLPQDEWSRVLREALDGFGDQPSVLQEFHKGKLVEHPYWDEDTQALQVMKGRVRLCPYYFMPRDQEGRITGKPRLSGVLATICPEDKKILHGMRDAILAPCTVHEEGY